MSDETAQAHYATLVAAFAASPDVAVGGTPAGRGRVFGSGALTVDGRIFAMLSHGTLVVKLPRTRVEALVEAGEGERFDPGHGRVMREWLSVRPGLEQRWQDLAMEALAFVRTGPSRRPSA